MMVWISIAASLMAALGCVHLVVAAVLAGRLRKPCTGTAPIPVPGVTILKPLHGDEPGLYDNLASFCAQDYGGPIQIIFGVQSPEDGAIAVVRRLQQSHPGRDLALVVDATMHGPNRKVSNLVNMARHIRQEVVVLADSDIRVGPHYLAEIASALAAPGVGVVTCLYHGLAINGVMARLFALGINAHFLPNALVGLANGLARPCFGSTIAMRRKTLAAIGGFAAFADGLADDYAIGAAVRAQGDTVAIPPFTLAHVCAAKTLRELWRHELRWARTVLAVEPLAYCGLVFAQPLPFALLAVALGVGTAALLPALGLTVAALAGRLVLLRRLERAATLEPQSYWLVPVRDLLSFAIFVASFFGRDVSWRGSRFRVWAGGRLAKGGSPDQ